MEREREREMERERERERESGMNREMKREECRQVRRHDKETKKREGAHTCVCTHESANRFRVVRWLYVI